MTLNTQLLALCAAVCLAASGCAPSGQGAGAEQGSKGGGAVLQGPADGSSKAGQVAFVTNNASDFWTIARRGVEKADKELESVEVSFLMPGDGTAAEQKRIVDDLVAKGVQGIAISPVDPKNQTEMLNSVAERAVLITQDSDAPESKRSLYVGTDNKAAGRMAGEELKKALPKGGKVMVFVGSADAQNAKDRFDGLKEAVAGSGIEILDLRTDGTDRVKAKANVVDALVKTPDLAGLVGLWSYNGPAILNAVKESGKLGKVQIVAFDEEEDTLAGVKDGHIFATIVQQPFEFGYQSVKWIDRIINEGKSVVPEGGVEIVPTRVISKGNVAEFKKQMDELRKG